MIDTRLRPEFPALPRIFELLVQDVLIAPSCRPFPSGHHSCPASLPSWVPRGELRLTGSKNFDFFFLSRARQGWVPAAQRLGPASPEHLLMQTERKVLERVLWEEPAEILVSTQMGSVGASGR